MNSRFISAVVIASSLLVACPRGSDRQRDRPVVQLVPRTDPSDDRILSVTLGEYRFALARMRLEREETLYAKPLPPELEALVLDRLIERRLLSAEAARLQVAPSTTAVSRELAQMKSAFPPDEFERLLIDTYQTEADLERIIRRRLTAIMVLERAVMERALVPEAEVRAAWDKKPAEEKVRAPRIRAAQIVVRSEEDGRQLLKALKDGEDFGALARRMSVAPEAIKGGDLGWFERGVMPAVFDDMCFPLQPGQVSPLTASEYGFHVCKVLEVEDERPLTYEETRAAIHRELSSARARAAEAEYLQSLRAPYEIVKNEGLLGSVN